MPSQLPAEAFGSVTKCTLDRAQEGAKPRTTAITALTATSYLDRALRRAACRIRWSRSGRLIAARAATA